MKHFWKRRCQSIDDKAGGIAGRRANWKSGFLYCDRGKHVDMDSFEDGTGVLILHNHMLSAVLNTTTEAANNQEEPEEKRSKEFTLCGYLDR